MATETRQAPIPSGQACAYRVLRYVPNLLRDEFINIGIVLEEAQGERRGARLIEEQSELARLRRLHPEADLDVIRALGSELAARLEGAGPDAAAPESVGAGVVAKLEETLSNVLQISPPRGVLAEDFQAELDRLYAQQVSPPAARQRAAGGRLAAAVEATRAWIRARANDVFQRAGVLRKMERGVRVEEYTEMGDPFRFDYGYRRNGTRGFVQALALGRDPAQAKVLAFTAARVRDKLAASEFTAVTEAPPREANPREQFVARLLEAQGITLVPSGRLEEFARRLAVSLR